jgi:CMP-N-acetylneuraminic acid synthetase
MPRARGVDIDTAEDLQYAEFLLRHAVPEHCAAV